MKILIILPRFPYPLEKGDKLRAYHQLRLLSENNEVYLFALSHNRVDQSAYDEVRKYCKEICVARLSKLSCALRVLRNLLTVRSLQIGFWDSRKARRLCRNFEAQVQPDVVYAQMIRTIKYAAHSSLPKVLDFQDALSMNVERAMQGRRGLRYFFLHFEFKMLRSAEYNACSIFDRMTIISETDRDAISQHHDTEIAVVRNGVDFDYFSPQAGVEALPGHDIVFCGNMQYKPNIDASRFLVEDVMPLVWRSHPEARVVLAGATPTAAVRQLASQRVTVTGSVPDIRPYYASSKVFVAPMRKGSGLQNKLLEAMSMGVPCVTTSLANDSLGADDGKELLVGNNAKELADAIVRLLDNKELCETISTNALAFVKKNYSWSAAVGSLEEVLRQAVAKHSNAPETELDIDELD